ncbi:hypothetical protein PR202_ga28465 [Eleusine coracana subsp. coracana]|uniref:Uncharacterized protein n=1 Tax=Eleusine coracana subsp. coracana TaxID=191504 RepID=A0AAV5DJT6_ELECO|nr:hypothetical protein PR202_ga28465 [Eleusine coracana subsp. coracana]
MPVSLAHDCETYAQHKKDAMKEMGRTSYTPYVHPGRGAVIGDEIYFTLRWGNAIVKYELSRNCISMIDSPRNPRSITLMEMGDNTLGFAYSKALSLYVWSRKVRSGGAAEWMQYRVIELEGTIPVANPGDRAFVIGYAEGLNVIFMATSAGLFTFELESGRVKKIDEPQVYFNVLPYMSFYTPGHGTLSSLTRIH